MFELHTIYSVWIAHVAVRKLLRTREVTDAPRLTLYMTLTVKAAGDIHVKGSCSKCPAGVNGGFDHHRRAPAKFKLSAEARPKNCVINIPWLDQHV